VKDVTAIILGGGRGSRLYPLTLERSKPAVGFAGKYRLIDIPISNCINSGVKKVFILTQFLSASLHRHIMQAYAFDPPACTGTSCRPTPSTCSPMDSWTSWPPSRLPKRATGSRAPATRCGPR